MRVTGTRAKSAYRPTLPVRLLGFLPRWCRPAPIPEDAAQALADRAEDMAAMHASLSCRELAQMTVGGALGRMLARLQRRSLQALIAEAFNDVLRKHGESPIGE